MAPRADPAVLRALGVVLDVVVPAAESDVATAEIGVPDRHRALLAGMVLAELGRTGAGAGPAREYLQAFRSGSVTVTPGKDLAVLRAALRLAPPPAGELAEVDAALGRSVAAWRLPEQPADSLVGLVDVARFLAAQRTSIGRFERTSAAVRDKAASLPRCPSSDPADRVIDTVTASAVSVVASFAARCATRSPSLRPPTGAEIDQADVLLLVEMLRAVADQQSLGADTELARVAPRIVPQLEQRLAMRGGYAAGSVVPLSVLAGLVTATRDAHLSIDIGARSLALAEAVDATGGATADLLGRGSVLDGVLGRVMLRWISGRAGGGSVVWPREPAGSVTLAQRARGLFDRGTPTVATPGRPDRGEVALGPGPGTASVALDGVLAASHGACDATTMRQLEEYLVALPQRSDGREGLRSVESGTLPWAVLGVLALASCQDPHAAEISTAIRHQIAAQRSEASSRSRLDDLVTRWAVLELSCTAGQEGMGWRAPASRGMTPELPPVPALVELSAESAVLGLSTIIYAETRSRRIALDGCGGDLVDVLRGWW